MYGRRLTGLATIAMSRSFYYSANVPKSIAVKHARRWEVGRDANTDDVDDFVPTVGHVPHWIWVSRERIRTSAELFVSENELKLY